MLLFLTGDVMTGRGIDQVLPHASRPRLYEPFARSALDYLELAERAHGPIPRPVGYAYVWGDALAILDRKRPHARIVNLETSVTTSDQAAPKGINYRMHPHNVPVLAAAKLDCCTLANNHVLDWGRSGLLETLESLARAGVATAGAGRDAASARAPAVLSAPDGGRVLVFAFGTDDSGIPPEWNAGPDLPGVNRLPDLSPATVERIAATVAAVKRPNDVAVASIHWGPNWGFAIPDAQRDFAHALVDRAHVDLVQGHSSHHPKAVEVYHRRLILYGCGDFLDDYEGIAGYDEFRPDLVLMYFPSLDASSGELLGLEMVPLEIRHFRLRAAPSDGAAWLRATLDRESRRFGGRVSLRDGSLFLEPA